MSESLKNELKTTLEALDNVSFHTIDKKGYEEELELYLEQSRQYYAPAEIDSDDFATRWYRVLGLRQQMANFQKLIDICSGCWKLLNEAGRQSDLGKMAGLIPTHGGIPPTGRILFDPLAPPANAPLFFPNYLDLFRGPHEFGARVFWWCAATADPATFGYGMDLQQKLVGQPFWFYEDEVDGKELLRPHEEALRSIRLAARFAAQIWPTPNGPTPTGFHYNGIDCPLGDAERTFMEACWPDCMTQEIDVVKTRLALTGKSPPRGTISSLANRLNAGLHRAGIRVSSAKGRFEFVFPRKKDSES